MWAGKALGWTVVNLMLPLGCCLGLSCLASERAPRPASPTVAKPASKQTTSTLGPARYMAYPASGWIERTEQGVDRAVLGEQRVEIHHYAITPIGQPEPRISAGAAIPTWAQSENASIRYVFWFGKDVYASDSFEGELNKIATLPNDVGRASPWLSGLVLNTSGGIYEVNAKTADVRPFQVAGVVSALALDPKRALGFTVFGHAMLTLDGGSSYNDIRASLGDAVAMEIQGDEFAVTLAGGRQRFIDASGQMSDTRTTVGEPRGQPPPNLDPRWPDRDTRALEAAVTHGLLDESGQGAVVTTRGFVGRVDLRSGLTSSSAELPESSGDCRPFQARDTMLVLCGSGDRAMVIDVSDVPRIERSFDLGSVSKERDRFIGNDGGGLGYLGPCNGVPKPVFDVDTITHASSYNASPQQSDVFCVRKGPLTWVEHRLEPPDQADVVAWIPRPEGGAVALIARPGPFLNDEPRTETRKGLHIVRFARNEPPMSFPQYTYTSPTLLARNLTVHPDDTIEGWFPVQQGSINQMPMTIDPSGVVHRYATPVRANHIVTSGPFALIRTEDGQLFETVNWGQTWLEVEPPPGDPFAYVSNCSAVGCKVGSFLRLGWNGAAADVTKFSADPERSARIQRANRERRQYRRPPPLPPLARISCSFAGPPTGQRIAESFGFGVTPTAVPRTSPIRLGSLGMMIAPWSGRQISVSGDIELAWIKPFDLSGEIHRMTIPLTAVPSISTNSRPYDTQIGYVIDRQGRVAPITLGRQSTCFADILDLAGMTRPLGGCATQPSVGVDLGDQVLLLSNRYSNQVISSVPLQKQQGQAPLLRELRTQPVSSGTQSLAYGAGSLKNAPVFVAVDASGHAVLVEVDKERGTLGPEQVLLPLTELRPGNHPGCVTSPDQARIVFPFDTEIGLVEGSLPGINASGTKGVGIIRWSKTQACLDAVEINVRDERYELDVGYYDPPGTVKKVMAHFSGPLPIFPLASKYAPSLSKQTQSTDTTATKAKALATLVLISLGQEVRQPLVCKGITP